MNEFFLYKNIKMMNNEKKVSQFDEKKKKNR